VVENDCLRWKNEIVTDVARSALEAKTGESVITGENFLPPKKSGLK
jgi:hypothetical protein